MALIKFGAAIVDARGSIAGTTFSRNKSGAYVRARVKPVNPKSVRQEAARTILSYLAEYWHKTLSPTVRGHWETYAAAVPMLNKLGETIHLSGYNHFMRSNSVRMTSHPTAVNFAPTVLSLPAKDNELVCAEENITAQTFTFNCNSDLFAANGDPIVSIMLDQGQPQLVSRNTYHGPWRYMGFIDVPEGTAGTATENAPFTFALDQKVWFRARTYTNEGRTSTPWQLAPRTITAD